MSVVTNILTSVPSKKEKLPLSATHPELASEAVNWDTSKFTYGSDKKMTWRCPLGHIWEATIGHRTLRKDGCPFCSGKKVLAGFNDLNSQNSELASEADGWDPETVTVGSSRRKDWICTLGHRWTAPVSERTRGFGCPFCAGQKVLAGFNDLASNNPHLASEALGWDPSQFTQKSGLKKTWKCSSGHIFEATIRHRSNGTKCPYCAGQKVLVGFNDLESTHPEIAISAFGWNPKSLTATSGKTRNWQCEKGHIWQSRVIHRKDGSGCPTCADYGFSPDKDAIIYFVKNTKLGMLQIGITNSPKSRLPKHTKRGWEVIETTPPMPGELAKDWETRILRMLKSRGADLSNNSIAGKFDGYTEAWSKDCFPVESLKKLMQLTEKYEQLEK